MSAVPKAGRSLYDADVVAWLDEQSALARAGWIDRLDLANIAEELAEMAASSRREVRSRLIKLLHHLLKCEHQPERRTSSWTLTIREQRRELRSLIEESPSLRPHALQVFGRCYADAREDAATETGLPLKLFPKECPYTLDQALDPEFWPGTAPSR